MLVKRIDEEIEKYSLLKHPFYRMWNEGTLTIDQLKGYSKEYFFLVKAIPEMLNNITKHINDPEILNNLREEVEHIELWKNFVLGIGAKLEEYDPTYKVKLAVDTMLKLSKDIYGVASIYAYEAQLPEISKKKVEGLIKFYNIRDEKTLEYHKVHSVVDIRHSLTWKRLLEKEEDQKFLEYTIRSLKAQNMLLDGIYERYIICTN